MPERIVAKPHPGTSTYDLAPAVHKELKLVKVEIDIEDQLQEQVSATSESSEPRDKTGELELVIFFHSVTNAFSSSRGQTNWYRVCLCARHLHHTEIRTHRRRL